MGVIVS